jgi:uncharacterized protein YcfJ
MIRSLIIAVVLLVVGFAGAGLANAGEAKGHLLVSVGAATAVATPPGQVRKVVAAECPAGTVFSIDAIRAAFPTPVTVCTGVVVTSQVPAEVEPVPV